jgi:diaminopimelate decarboxylase
LKVGTPPNKIVMNGNGKTADEIAYAIDSDVLCINVDSAEDLELVAETARLKNRIARIAIRINPDIDAQTHPYISTGLKKSKFGVPISQAVQLYRKAREYKELQIIGMHCHIGSQITQVGPLLAAAQSVRDFVLQLKSDDIDIHIVNLGGGLGIVYRDENPLTPSEWAKVIMDTFGLHDRTSPLHDMWFILEPGRNLVGTAGALVASVVHLKRTETKNFLVLDTGMNALMRPSLYDAYHEIVSVRVPQTSEVRLAASEVSRHIKVDVVGPICESADVLGKERELPILKRGDLIAVLNAGAYGFSMASRYNQQPLPAEVVVQGDTWRVVTQRETWEQMAEREVG